MTRDDRRHTIYFWTTVAFLVVLSLGGGSSRGDVPALLVIRPLSVILFAAALACLPTDRVRQARYPFLLLGAVIVIALLQLIPLPPAIWGALPGRGVFLEAAAQAGVADAWRPLSLVPARTASALFGVFVPLAVLALTLGCSARGRWRLLIGTIAFAFLSLALGAMQVAGGADSQLYFYKYVNAGLPTGFFANRNHQAVLLAAGIPLLAVIWDALDPRAETRVPWRWLAPAGGLILAAGLIVTGSRLGVLLGVLAAAGVPLVTRRFDLRLGIAGIAVLVLLGLFYLHLGQGSALDRLLASRASTEPRFVAFGPVIDLVLHYLPSGTGLGTFREVFEQAEPSALLKPTYLNRAHDDLLETVLESGILGLALAVAAVTAFLGRAWSIWRTGGAPVERAGMMILALIGIASVGDYPLRTPLLQALAIVAVVWSLPPSRTARDERPA